MMAVCTEGHEIAAGMRFCGQCGSPVAEAASNRCPYCSALNRDNVRFCGR